MVDQELQRLRARVDKINRRIAILLLKRIAVIDHIAKIKSKHKMPVYDSARETQMFLDVDKITRSPKKKRVLRNVFQSIFSTHRRYQLK